MSMPTAHVKAEPKQDGRPRGFRPDIQGLRALAVSLVVIYHLWPHGLTGGFAGVDVFFVISGFLITSHLMKAPPRTGADFAAFWARRIRRLLPAAFVVLAVTAAAVRILAPETQWKDAGSQIVSAAFYVQNWVLAATSVDYLAADDAASPVQHFWSLSVEEQFYLLWPIIIGLAAWISVRRATDLRKIVRWAILAVVVVSLVFSVYFTATNPGPAYFVTPTRMWELALGGLAAAIAGPTGFWGRIRVRAIASWVGIAGIVLTGLSFTGETPFPSYQAVLPVAATALILWAKPEGRGSPAPILGLRPVQYLGDISYSVYLWHWPMIALLPLVSGSLGPLDKAAILVLTLVLAGLTKTFVEDRFRFTRVLKGDGSAYRFAAAGMVILLLVGGGFVWESNLRVYVAAENAASAEANAGPCFGARSAIRGFGECPQDNAGPMIPEPALAKDDKSAAYVDGCWSNQPFTERPTCTYGDGPTRIALVGNSHAGHWLPALQKIAKEKGWTITTFLVSRCNPSDARQKFDTAAKSEACHQYGQWVLDQTAHGQFDRVITSQRQSVPVEGTSWSTTEKPAVQGYSSYLEKWTADGTPVTVIRDVPYPGRAISNIPDCLAEHSGNYAACSGTPKTWEWMDPLASAARNMDSPNVNVVNMEKYFCIEGKCPAVIGGVITYFDGSHITATYGRTLAGPLGRELETTAE